VSEEAIGCARPTGTVVGAQSGNGADQPKPEETKTKEAAVTIKVGGKAPDFQAPAYYQGNFTTVKLSDFLGQWVLVCFYPGDFTFV
jgi:hypothetical protein